MAIESALAMATGLTPLLTQLSDLATHTADNITDKWYEASKDLADFQELETKLKRKIDIWREALRNEGMSDDIRIRELLNDAIECLEGEKRAMDRLQSNCCFFRFMTMFQGRQFPPLVKESMKRAVDAFENIPNAFRERIEPARVLEELADSRPDPYQIIVDRRIIKLTDTQDKVMQLLNDKTGNQVVTLHGGPGSGKTSLAKLVAQYYQEHKTTFADGARFLSCGRNATVDSICKELFQSLSIQDMNVESAPEAKAEQAFKPKGSTPSEGQSSAVPSLVKKLARRLKERHLLIILDDVSNPELLKEKLIVPHAKDVKYLITSQMKNIYDGATVIHMQSPTMEEAMTILANHIPNSSNGEIPSNLQEKAIQIIHKADWIPMTLAIVGRQIDDFDDEPSWDAVLHNFSEHAYGDKLAASMLMAVDALGENSNTQKLLYLLAMCKLASIPEAVIQLLFQHIDSTHLSTFKKYEKNLKDRDFITVEGKYWILREGYQVFILKYKKEEISELLCTLMKGDNNDGDDELLKALCVLYIVSKKDTFTPIATLAMEKAAREFNICLEDQDMISDLETGIYRLMHLLCPWKQALEEYEIRRHQLASKVLKQFVSKRNLDDESFVRLLDEGDIYEDMCGVLSGMHLFTIDQKKKPILTKETNLVLEELIYNLNPTSDDILITMDTLSLLIHKANCDIILDNDHVLKDLLEILRSNDKNDRQLALMCSTLNLVGILARTSSIARGKIAFCEELIEILISIFQKDLVTVEINNMKVKDLSIYALGSIALEEKISIILLKSPNFLTSIAEYLEDLHFKDKYGKFLSEQGYVATISTIQCLLSLLKANDIYKGDIGKHEYLLHVLTKIFETYNTKETCNTPQGYNADDEAYVTAIVLQTLTLIEPTKYNKIQLYSKEAYMARGKSNAYCGLYKQAFEDYKRADRIDNLDNSYYKSTLCFLKVMLKDYKGALHYAKWFIDEQPDSPFLLQEIGVVKELMEDYEGAKIHLDKALGYDPDDYEVLKHRAFVNFKLGYEKEAHEDAQKALKVMPIHKVDRRDLDEAGCLGTLSIQFLDYDLH